MYTKMKITDKQNIRDIPILSCSFKVLFKQSKLIVILSLICCTFSVVQTEKLRTGVSLLTVTSGSDRHVVPVASWSLGAAVAAQVLVDAGHLVSGHIIRHLQVWVGLGAPHVHCLQQVLTVHHSDLPQGEETERCVFISDEYFCVTKSPVPSRCFFYYSN